MRLSLVNLFQNLTAILYFLSGDLARDEGRGQWKWDSTWWVMAMAQGLCAMKVDEKWGGTVAVVDWRCEMRDRITIRYAMLWYILLPYAPLCDAVLCYAAPYYAMLYCSMQCSTLPCGAMLRFAERCHAVKCYTFMYFAIPCHAVLYYIILWCTMSLYCAILFYAMLWCVPCSTALCCDLFCYILYYHELHYAMIR